jgi:hypothetical protein
MDRVVQLGVVPDRVVTTDLLSHAMTGYGPITLPLCHCDSFDLSRGVQLSICQRAVKSTRARKATTMIRKDGNQVQGTQSIWNNTKADGIEQPIEKAPSGRQNTQSRKGVSAPGNTCRPEALASNSAQERYT